MAIESTRRLRLARQSLTMNMRLERMHQLRRPDFGRIG